MAELDFGSLTIIGIKTLLFRPGISPGSVQRVTGGWCSLYCTVLYYTVSVLGRDKGYLVKYNPLPEGLSLTVYPESSPHTDIISF